MTSSSISKRLHGRSPRYEPSEPIPIRLSSRGDWKEGVLHNLSERGAYISLQGDLWTGEEVKIVIETPQFPGGCLEVYALAIWESRDRGRESRAQNGYGLLFRHEKDQDRRLSHWINRLQESGLLKALS